MLAEPRSRKKTSSNPRGTLWVNDERNIGAVMLKKMGWKDGLGLGANSNGRLHAVKVSRRFDNRGVGATSSDVEQHWTEAVEDYDDILSKLSEKFGANKSPKDESHSRASGNVQPHGGHVRIKRFIKGKDLTQASSGDMDAIFGRAQKRHLSSTSKCVADPLGHDKLVDSSKCCQSITPDLKQTTSNENLSDYFARRMKEIKRKKSLTLRCEDICDSKSVSVETVGHDPIFTSDVKKSEKKRKKDLDGESPNSSHNGVQTEVGATHVTDDATAVVASFCSGVRKKKKATAIVEVSAEFGSPVELTNTVPASDGSTPLVDTKMSEGDSVFAVKKKRKKTLIEKKNFEETSNTPQILTSSPLSKNFNSLISKKKKKDIEEKRHRKKMSKVRKRHDIE